MVGEKRQVEEKLKVRRVFLRPASLAAPRPEAAIYADAPALGPELTARLPDERKRLQNPDDLAGAKLDADTYIRIARRAGLEDKETLGELRARAEAIFAAEERKTPDAFLLLRWREAK